MTARAPSKSPAKKTAAAKKTTAKKAAAPAKKAVAAKKAAPAKKAARVVAKVSPMRGMGLDAYIAAKASGWQGEAIRKLAELVKAVAPDVEIEVKWGQPVFSVSGPLGFMRASKQHVTIGFWRGAEFDDPSGVLEGAGDRMKHAKLGSVAEIRAEVLRPFVEQAVRLNREKGDPTRRG